MTILDAENAGHAVRWELPRLGAAISGLPTARELDELERAAFQEGVERGRSEGYAQGRSEALAHIGQLKQIIARFSRPLGDLEAELEQILVHLSGAIAAALWRSMVGPNPELIQRLVRESIGALPAGARDVEVQLHPEDMAAMNALMPEGLPAVRLVSSLALVRGDVRVHCDSVRLDATLNTRLANAAEALLNPET